MDGRCAMVILIEWSNWCACMRLDSDIDCRSSVRGFVCLGGLMQDVYLPADIPRYIQIHDVFSN